MAKEIREYCSAGPGENYYSGNVVDTGGSRRFAQLEVSVDCEAELAVLLMSASRKGILRLDRILPFLTPDAPSVPP